MALSKAEKVELAATIIEAWIAGESDDVIMATLGLDAEAFAEAKRFMLEAKAADFRGKSREHVYVEYLLDQKHNLRLVDNLLTKLDPASSGGSGKAHYNAFVGAIRLRVDITDRVLERGFDLGIFRKTQQGSAPTDTTVGTKGVAGLTDDELRKEIAEMTGSTAELMSKFGDVDMSRVETGPLHRGPGLIDAVEEDDEALLAVEEPEPAPPPPPVAKAPIVVRKKATAMPAKPAPKPPVKPAR